MPSTAPEPYDFLCPPQVRFGPGRSGEIGELVAGLGGRAWIVSGSRGLGSGSPAAAIAARLAADGTPAGLVAAAPGEPTVDHVVAALSGLPGERDGAVVVAVGGGSAIDLAKAVAALAVLVPPGPPPAAAELDELVVDHLEGVGRGRAIVRAPLPLIAVPTTAGTGAEATRNAVISCPRRRFKKSMRSPLLVPRVAVVDPDLTAGCDRGTIAAAGLDCITQLVESFICRFTRPLPRALVLEGLPGAVAALPRLLAGEAATAAADRARMSHAALLSGLALTNSGLGMAHGVAAALGVLRGTPHGLACAVMLPTALEVNREVAAADLATLERAVDPGAPARDAAAADAFLARVRSLCRLAEVPARLADLGVGPAEIEWLARNSGGASMRGNPVALDEPRLLAILRGMA